MSVECRSPILFVEEMQAARAFYEDLLQQRVEIDFGVNVGYEGGLALWLRSHAEPIIYGEAAPAEPHAAPARPAFEMYFEADDIVAVWQRMAEAGVKSVHEIREQPWGQRVFHVYDPDGNLVEIAELMSAVVARLLGAGSTLEEAAARTGMPIEVVRHMAAAPSDPLADEDD